MADKTPQDASLLSLDFVEAEADAWAERINLNSIIDNAISPFRLNPRAPSSVRAAFGKRMKEQVDTLIRLAFAEGIIHALDGFRPVTKEGSEDG